MLVDNWYITVNLELNVSVNRVGFLNFCCDSFSV